MSQWAMSPETQLAAAEGREVLWPTRSALAEPPDYLSQLQVQNQRDVLHFIQLLV